MGESNNTDKTMVDKTCFIITGTITINDVCHLSHSFKDIPRPRKIISTWDNQDTSLLEYLSQVGFIVVPLKEPDYITSNNDGNRFTQTTNRQAYHIVHACKVALDLGFEYCVRVRTDMMSSDYPQLLRTIIPSFNDSKLISLAGMTNPEGEYFFLDCLLAGKINQIIKFFHVIEPPENSRACEHFWIETYLKKTNLTKEDILSVFTFCAKDLQKTNIVIGWPMKCMYEVIHMYCDETFNTRIWYK